MDGADLLAVRSSPTISFTQYESNVSVSIDLHQQHDSRTAVYDDHADVGYPNDDASAAASVGVIRAPWRKPRRGAPDARSGGGGGDGGKRRRQARDIRQLRALGVGDPITAQQNQQNGGRRSKQPPTLQSSGSMPEIRGAVGADAKKKKRARGQDALANIGGGSGRSAPGGPGGERGNTESDELFDDGAVILAEDEARAMRKLLAVEAAAAAAEAEESGEGAHRRRRRRERGSGGARRDGRRDGDEPELSSSEVPSCDNTVVGALSTNTDLSSCVILCVILCVVLCVILCVCANTVTPWRGGWSWVRLVPTIESWCATVWRRVWACHQKESTSGVVGERPSAAGRPSRRGMTRRALSERGGSRVMDRHRMGAWTDRCGRLQLQPVHDS